MGQSPQTITATTTKLANFRRLAFLNQETDKHEIILQENNERNEMIFLSVVSTMERKYETQSPKFASCLCHAVKKISLAFCVL